MSGRFVLTSQVPPPHSRTLQCRSEGSVFDAALFQWSGWKMLVPGGEVSMPDPPKEWWLSERMAKELNIAIPAPSTEPSPQPQAKRGQLALDFSGYDSETQSRRDSGKNGRYPDTPGFKRAGTSQDAAEEMKADASALQAECLSAIKAMPRTADEVAAVVERSVLAIRPRISELRLKGLVIETSERRRNASGKMASVWRST